MSDIRHINNVANFEDVISYCTVYGAQYNPSLAAIQLANMNTLKANADASIASETTTRNALANAVNARQDAFKPIKSLITRIVNAVKASGATKLTYENALAIQRKAQGKRAKPIKKTTTTETTLGPPEEEVHISVSQQGYDSMVEHLGTLIDLLGTIPTYVPNEPDLTLGSLNGVLAGLKLANTNAINATTAESNAVISRNFLLYADITGLVDVAGEVKAYVKSVFGATSPQYKQISKIKFKKFK